MPSQVRLQRISDRIRQDLAEMLVRGEIQDPGLIGISITDARVDRELYFADIYVSAVEGKIREKEIMKGLERASGFIRKKLSQQIELRSFPKLRFHWDPTPENADHIEQLLAQIRGESKGSVKKK
jgi:ribosome-binding factor A